MQLQSAHILALQLLEKHKLYDWTFAFDRATVRFGSCQFHKKCITLSRKLTELNSEEEVRDTILHEIAHALIGPRHNHDAKWKAVAKSIGCSGKVRYKHDEVVMPSQKYTVTCSHCEQEFQAQKKRRIACKSCCTKYNNGKYNERFRLEFTENNRL